jgi:MFS family permease
MTLGAGGSGSASGSGNREAEWLYGLAYLGAFLAFIPLLILLLPRRVEAIAGQADLPALSWLLLIGGVVASVSHIFAGMWSDRWLLRFGSRRGLIAIGVGAMMAAYVGLGSADTIATLGFALVLFQFALNLAFAPLGALLADYVPDARKGRIAGRLNATLPISIAAVSLLSWLYPTDSDAAFYLVGAVGALMILPLLIQWPFGELQKRGSASVPIAGVSSPKRDFAIAAAARLLVQLGAVVMTSYLYAYLASVAAAGRIPGITETTAAIGSLSLVATAAAIVASVTSGLFSDLQRIRRLPLAISAVIIAGTLAILSTPPSWLVLVLAFAVFHAALASFLSLDTALVAQIVSGNKHRGALLGVMNLTNTLPSIIAPIAALLAIQNGGLGGALPQLVLLSAGTALAAALIIPAIRSVR